MKWILHGVVLVVVLAFCQARSADPYHPRYKRSLDSNTQENLDKQEADWSDLAQKQLKNDLERKLPNSQKANNIVLFIGDGMGVSTVTAARWHKAQAEGTQAADTALSWDRWPVSGISKTYNVDRMTPDSAGTATAFLCGEKAQSGTIGVNQQVKRGDCAAADSNTVKSMLQFAIDEGKSTGIVTTTRITHATPAASFAHVADRDWESDSAFPEELKEECPDFKDIALQLIHTEINKKIQVILGGGRRELMPNNETDPEYPELRGYRTDGRNLIEEWGAMRDAENVEWAYVDKQNDFDAVDPETTDYLLGLFDHSHMQFEVDREGDPFGEPSLAQMVDKAIKILQKNPNGFMLLVEGGRIDHAHHNNNAYRALSDTIALDDAVAKADELTSIDDTLLVVTADHSHVFTLGGHPGINVDIFGLTTEAVGKDDNIANDRKPFTTLSYTNGPGWHDHRNYSLREDMSELSEDMKPSKDNFDFIQDAGVPLNSETHAGEDVAVYARGPLAYLLTGTYDQSYIAHAMQYAACIGNNKDHCEHTSAAPHFAQSGFLLAGLVVVAMVTRTL